MLTSIYVGQLVLFSSSKSFRLYRFSPVLLIMLLNVNAVCINVQLLPFPHLKWQDYSLVVSVSQRNLVLISVQSINLCGML